MTSEQFYTINPIYRYKAELLDLKIKTELTEPEVERYFELLDIIYDLTIKDNGQHSNND